jgi:polyisoprenoid-binding protein YceI
MSSDTSADRSTLGLMSATGTFQLGPENASLQVNTYREGVGAKVGHDLVIDVTRWEATVALADDPAASSIQLTADPRSLQVREGLRGLKPLSDKDRADIRKTIDAKVLGGSPISFMSRSVRGGADGGAPLVVEGDLTLAGQTRPVTAELAMTDDGHVTGTIPVTQTAWGIKPYRGLMGALKVRDDVEVVIDAQLAPG